MATEEPTVSTASEDTSNSHETAAEERINGEANLNGKDESISKEKEETSSKEKEVTSTKPKGSILSEKVDETLKPEDTDASVKTDKPKSEISSEELDKKIVKQIEYYFGNFNLPRDNFLQEQVKIDDGWVSMETMVKFKRLADLTTDHASLRNALKHSSLMEVDNERNKIRRSPSVPLPAFGDNIKEETVKRTIYCKGLPKDGSVKLDILLEFFKPYGPYENIHMRHFFDKPTKRQGFKGSILIVFPTVEKAQEFMDIDDIKYNNMPLLRKWHAHYLEEKKAEFEERKARKEARLKRSQEEPTKKDEVEPLPKGTFLHLEGFSGNTTREDIKAAFIDFSLDVAHIDFFKGNSKGYVRLATPDSNKDAAGLLQSKLKINDADINVRVVEGEEEEEQLKKAVEARSKSYAFANRSGKRRNRGRGGGGPMKRRKY